MSELVKDPKTSSSDRDKAIRLVDYLTRIALLRSKIIRDVDDYQSVLWINDIPSEKECFTRAWGRDEDYDSDVWIEIQGRREPELPNVPNLCKDWVKPKSLRNKSDLPELSAQITVWDEETDQPQSISDTKYLEDYPEIQKAWDAYIQDKWLNWVAQHNAWESIYKVYSQLFSIHQELTRLGEEYELILGLGLLIWRSPSGQHIRRHLLVADATLEFEAGLGRFTIKPHPEGTKFRPEFDMMDIGERPAGAEQVMKEVLKKDDDPWERDIIDGTLKSLIHSLDSQGEYKDALDATGIEVLEKPVVVYAPALILRRRSAKGLTDTLQRIRELIEKGEDIPSEFLGLAEIQQVSDKHAAGDSCQTNSNCNGEVFFPKPSNAEQRLIVDKIRAISGVIVQGPPGTGKSHTIANLICHLLATGQRTLITAKTPRALRVLEGLVPRELRSLCINLIGSGFKERGNLESSVRGILQKLNDWDEDKSRLDRKRLEEKLRKLREEKSYVERRLRDIRESETLSRSISQEAFQGTAAEIAEAVNKDRNDYEWFTDDVREDKTCPISDNNMRKILEDLRYFTAEKRNELLQELPNAFPSPARWKNLVENEVNATEEENSVVDGADEHVADKLSRSSSAYIGSLQGALNSFLHTQRRLMALGESWIEQVLRDAIRGETTSWREILRATRHAIGIVEPLVEIADKTDIQNPKNLKLNSLHNAANELRHHLENGGKLTYFCILPKSIVKLRRLIKGVLINDSRPKEIKDFQLLEQVLRVRLECEKVWGFWVERADKSQGPYQLQIGELKRLSGVLEEALSLEELTKRCRELIGQCTSVNEPLWFSESQVETTVASCNLAIARQRKRECEDEIQTIENPVMSLAKRNSAHPVASELLRAIRQRDVDGFVSAANRIQDLLKEQDRVQKLDGQVSAVRQHFPRLIDDLERTCGAPCWDDRIEKIQCAWCWAYARYWVEEYVRKEDVPALAKRAKQIEDEINSTIAKLSAQYAWSFCFSRLSKRHQENMVAWQQAMKKIGKGTGRQAWRYRREAQHYLNQCYEAAPAWVMPLHRVWDTVDPVPEMFDVIIVDEASQCGVESMPLLFLGKKILIVGDDKQISPDAVGLDIDDVYRLINEYLYDFNFHGIFHVASSLFDYGALRYGTQQRITLREHFRCMPEIIRFSNNLCYSGTPLIPLRQYGPDRLVPLKRVFINGGYREGSGNRVINRPEAEAVVEEIVKLCNNPNGKYDNKTMGVVVLQGEGQARLIETQLLERLGAEEIETKTPCVWQPLQFSG